MSTTEEIKPDFDRVAYEFSPYRGKHFIITIRAWRLSDSWVWNVYAHIFKSHPLFGKVSFAKNLPFHGGCTYDEIITTEPAEGIQYDWQKLYKCLKVGCDYNHCYDDRFNRYDPKDGVPYEIKNDVSELISAIVEHMQPCA